MDEPWKFITLSCKPPHTGTHHLTETLYNTLNIQEPQSRVEDTFEHLRKLFKDYTGTYNYCIIKTLRAGGFCPIHLLHSNWIHSSPGAPMNGFSPPFLSPGGHPTICPHQTLASDIPLTVWASVFSSQCRPWWAKNQSPSLYLVNLSATWTSTKANRKQICKPPQFWWAAEGISFQAKRFL